MVLACLHNLGIRIRLQRVRPRPYGNKATAADGHSLRRHAQAHIASVGRIEQKLYQQGQKQKRSHETAQHKRGGIPVAGNDNQDNVGSKGDKYNAEQRHSARPQTLHTVHRSKTDKRNRHNNHAGSRHVHPAEMVPENAVAKEAVEKGNVSTGDRRRQRTQDAASADRGSSAISRKANAQHKQRKLGKHVVEDSTRRAHHNGNAEEHRELFGAERIGAAAFFTVGVLSFATSIACQRFRAAAHKRTNHYQQHRNAKHTQARLITTERKRQQRNCPNKSNWLVNSPNAPDQACGQHRAQKRKRV